MESNNNAFIVYVWRSFYERSNRYFRASDFVSFNWLAADEAERARVLFYGRNGLQRFMAGFQSFRTSVPLPFRNLPARTEFHEIAASLRDLQGIFSPFLSAC